MEINSQAATTSGFFNDRLFFTQESPLFAKSISDFGKEFNSMSDYLKTVSKSMKQYIGEVKKISAIGEKMSQQFKAGFLASSNDPNSNSIMIIARSIADIISDISQSQEILALTLEQSFCEPIDNFCSVEVAKVINIQQQYQLSREVNDSVMTKYIQTDGHTKGINSSILDYRAFEIALQKRRFELNRYDMVANLNKLDNKKVLDVSEAIISTWVLIRAHYNHCSDRFTSSAKYLHELNTRQQKLNDCYYEKYGNKPDEKREKILLAMDEIVSKVETQVRGNGNNHLPASEIEKWYPGKFLGQMMNDKETNFISNSSSQASATAPTPPPTSSTNSSVNKNDESQNQNQQSAFSRLGAMGANLIGFGNKNSPNSSNNLSSQTPKSSPNSSNNLNLSSQTPNNELPKDPEEATEKSLSSQMSLATIEEVESKLQVLDRSYMKSLYDNNPLEELAGVIYQGYLWMKNTSSNKLAPAWVRLWFVLDDTKLYCIKEGETIHSPSEMKVVCDTTLASVREVKNSDVPFAFELSYANVKTFTLQAEGFKDFSGWIDSIRGAIETRLSSGISHPSLIRQTSQPSNTNAQQGMNSTDGSNLPHSSSSSSSSSMANHPKAINNANVNLLAAQQEKRKEMASLISGILRNNVSCAECGKDSPDWISLNLGCLICIECSGVHRSLGVHISKVRSLSLDDLDPEEYALVYKIGNKVSNSIWEEFIPTDYPRPKAKDSYSARDKFIRLKYLEKEFISRIDPKILDNLNFKLQMACFKDDLFEAAKALAYGASPNTIAESDFMLFIQSEGDVNVKNSFSGTESALHIAVKRGALSCCVLLILNGSDAKIQDKDNKTPVDLALELGHTSIYSYFTRKADLIKFVNIDNRSSPTIS